MDEQKPATETKEEIQVTISGSMDMVNVFTNMPRKTYTELAQVLIRVGKELGKNDNPES